MVEEPTHTGIVNCEGLQRCLHTKYIRRLKWEEENEKSEMMGEDKNASNERAMKRLREEQCVVYL